MDKSSKLEIYNEGERLVLREFWRSPNMCIHQLHERTGIPYPALLAIVKVMVGKGKILRTPELALGKTDYQFCSCEIGAKMNANQFEEEKSSPLVGLTETEMCNRVVMLKRMKRLLIGEWHPVVDVLLGDYERDIKRLGFLREPPDGDEMDVLDRDFNFGE